MYQISVSDLRTNLKGVLKEIEQGGAVDITSRGKVVAKLVPPDYSRDRARAQLREIGKDAYIGDILTPVDSPWKVMDDDNG